MQQHDNPPMGVPQEELTRPGVNLTRQMSDGKIAGMATALVVAVSSTMGFGRRLEKIRRSAGN